MKSEVMSRSKIYKIYNDIALKNEIIIFGSSYTAKFPFYELSKKYLLSNAIYNRSIEGITLYEASKILNDCVLDAKPAKIFYAFEYDPQSDITALESYKEILHKTKETLPFAKIFVLSAPNTGNEINKFNVSLSELCFENNIQFININYSNSYESIFKQLSPFLRNGKINFT